MSRGTVMGFRTVQGESPAKANHLIQPLTLSLDRFTLTQTNTTYEHHCTMLSALLNLPDLGIDPATGRLRTAGATKVVKKVIKKVTKAATQAAATANAATKSTDNTEAIISVPSTPPVEVVESVPSAPSGLEEFLTSLDPTVTALVLGALILIAFIIYRRKFSATGQVGNSVLIVGNMGAGKTALYYQLKQVGTTKEVRRQEILPLSDNEYSPSLPFIICSCVLLLL